MAKLKNQGPNQPLISVSMEIGERITLPSGTVQIPVKVITMSGEVRKSVTLTEVTANGVLLSSNVQTDTRTGEFGGVYDLPTGVTNIKVVARYHNGKAVVSTENIFPIPEPKTAKVPKAVKIVLGTPVLSGGWWEQSIQTVDDKDKPIEETVNLDVNPAPTSVSIQGNTDPAQIGSDIQIKITGGSAVLKIKRARWYFEITYSLPGKVDSVKQIYLTK